VLWERVRLVFEDSGGGMGSTAQNLNYIWLSPHPPRPCNLQDSGIPEGKPRGGGVLRVPGTSGSSKARGLRDISGPLGSQVIRAPPPSYPLRSTGGPHLRKGSLAVHHEQRCLAAAAVTHDHDLQLLPPWARGGGLGRGPRGVHRPVPAALEAVRRVQPG
jgi:hypothetical protein